MSKVFYGGRAGIPQWTSAGAPPAGETYLDYSKRMGAGGWRVELEQSPLARFNDNTFFAEGTILTISDFTTRAKTFLEGELATLGNGLEISINGSDWVPIEKAHFRVAAQFQLGGVAQATNPVLESPAAPGA